MKGAVDRKVLAGWEQAADRDSLHTRGARALSPTARQLTPGVTVVLAGAGDRFADTLDGIARQTVDTGLVEVVVVLTDGAGRAAVHDLGAARPALAVRVVTVAGAGLNRAFSLGVAAASRQYVTLVEAGDRLSPNYLEALLAGAGDGVVAAASVVADGEAVDSAADLAVGRLVSTALADRLFRTGVVDEVDGVFWLAAAVHGPAELTTAADAVYHRTAVPARPGTGDFRTEITERLATVVRLERLHADSGSAVGELVTQAVARQAERMGDYLAQHPDQHPEVVKELDRFPVFELPHGLVNRGMPRGLVVAYAFSPYADASAIVMAKRVRNMGGVADVVYNAMDRMRTKDQTVRRISGPFIADEAPVATPTYFSHWGSMEKFVEAGMAEIHKWEAEKGRYEWIYSRAHFAASHLLAAVYKLANPEVRWTAEFSDPLSKDMLDEERGTPVEDGPVLETLRNGAKALGLPIPESSNCFVWCEELTYVLADELIFTNPNQLEYMMSYCSDEKVAATARSKAVVSAHPTLPRDFYSMVDFDYPMSEGLIHLAYFGVFYATRGMDDVLAAVANAPEELRRKLRIHVFTTKPAELDRRAAELGIADCIQVGPYVRFLEFLNLTTKFDCLIVNDAFTADYQPLNPYLPSKWSDYKGSGTSVWGLTEAGSPLNGQKQLAYNSPVGDVEAAGKVLEQLVRDKLAERSSRSA
ncbi:hypothetical protein [Micromonospora siamensis]|uniref:hypothetical protein n=1 Tax=Micromonospora siamensis TaxID=299152 RepID=UPI000B5AF0E7|nr:hypothetical protein [Micromonospora siamensis]